MLRNRLISLIKSIFSSNLKIPEAMSSQRSEEFCGIVAYANSEKGFQGILKQRYSDFIVREIDKSGVIAQLTTLSGKELQSRSFPDHEKPDIAPEAVAEFVASLRGFVAIDDVTAVGMIEFLHMAAARETECPDSFTGKFPLRYSVCMNSHLHCIDIVCGSTDKPTRSAIHQLFKTKFKGLVESDTMQVNGVSSIRIQPSFKLKKGWNNR